MSHFTVLLKIPSSKQSKPLNETIEEMLAPYQENNMGDCPKEYLEFDDMTDDIARTDANEIITADSYMGKEHPESIGKTLLEHYGSYDDYVTGYHGYQKDETTGKYGYWDNPNKKWDWYQVGGRWSGFLPIKLGHEGTTSWAYESEPTKPGTADVAFLRDIDFEQMQAVADERIQQFWENYNKWLPFKYMPRDQIPNDMLHLEYSLHNILMNLGLRKCIKARCPIVDQSGQPIMEEDPFTKQMVQAWSQPEFEDIPFTLEELKTKYRWDFEWSTFAVLDEKGWHGKGEMGWWGCSSDTTKDKEKWSKSFFNRFLKNESPDTLLVVVDAHI